jgi:hypothetical protein
MGEPKHLTLDGVVAQACRNELVLGGVVFPVRKASFTLGANELSLQVDCAEPGPAFEAHDWSCREPKLYTQGAVLESQDPDADLVITGHEQLPEDQADEESVFALYLWEHEPVTRCQGALRSVPGGHRLELRGTAEVMGETFQFTLSTAITRDQR